MNFFILFPVYFIYIKINFLLIKINKWRESTGIERTKKID